jgi:Zn-dependent protease
MGWRDRDYAREEPYGFGSNPLMWLLQGRVRLFEVWGVTLYVQALTVVLAGVLLLLSLGGGGPFGGFGNTLLFLGTLLFIVVLHEFGHIWGARKTGGSASEVVLTPLGGMALAQPAKGWYPHTITILCGPLVNVLICAVGILILGIGYGFWPVGPFQTGNLFAVAMSPIGRVVFYVYAVSYFLLLFNLLPVFPLDGGQLLQGLLWWKNGWYKATLWTTTFGLIASPLLILYGFASSLIVSFIGLSCLLTCLSLRRQLVAAGPWAFQEEDGPDFAASAMMDPDEPAKESFRERQRRRRAEKRAEREAEAARRLESDLDLILAKISDSGMKSLTREEKDILEKARLAKSQ